MIGQTNLITEGKITRVYGGAPIILTKAAAAWHNRITKQKPNVWIHSRLPHDLWIGKLFTSRGKKLVHLKGIYSQPPWFYVGNNYIRQNGTEPHSAAFHYIPPANMVWMWSLWK